GSGLALTTRTRTASMGRKLLGMPMPPPVSRHGPADTAVDRVAASVDRAAVCSRLQRENEAGTSLGMDTGASVICHQAALSRHDRRPDRGVKRMGQPVSRVLSRVS